LAPLFPSSAAIPTIGIEGDDRKYALFSFSPKKNPSTSFCAKWGVISTFLHIEGIKKKKKKIAKLPWVLRGVSLMTHFARNGASGFYFAENENKLPNYFVLN
jgi:hypothetical protein